MLTCFSCEDCRQSCETWIFTSDFRERSTNRLGILRGLHTIRLMPKGWTGVSGCDPEHPNMQNCSMRFLSCNHWICTWMLQLRLGLLWGRSFLEKQSTCARVWSRGASASYRPKRGFVGYIYVDIHLICDEYVCHVIYMYDIILGYIISSYILLYCVRF